MTRVVLWFSFLIVASAIACSSIGVLTASDEDILNPVAAPAPPNFNIKGPDAPVYDIQWRANGRDVEPPPKAPLPGGGMSRRVEYAEDVQVGLPGLKVNIVVYGRQKKSMWRVYWDDRIRKRWVVTIGTVHKRATGGKFTPIGPPYSQVIHHEDDTTTIELPLLPAAAEYRFTVFFTRKDRKQHIENVRAFNKNRDPEILAKYKAFAQKECRRITKHGGLDVQRITFSEAER